MTQRRRFYAPPDSINRDVVMLSREESHHLTRVLRLKPGGEAFVFDGCGREYRCKVLKVDDSRAQLEVIAELRDRVESPIHLTLGQALAKGEKFDLIVQKATELGVATIVPLITENADVKLEEERSAKRLERWRRISLEALKQCGRRRLVEIRAPMGAGGLLNETSAFPVVVFSEKGGVGIADVLAGVVDRSSVTALIGPEGGWSPDELVLFEESGVKFVTLGPRVLRTETAAIAAISLIQHTWGDLSVESTR